MPVIYTRDLYVDKMNPCARKVAFSFLLVVLILVGAFTTLVPVETIVKPAVDAINLKIIGSGASKCYVDPATNKKYDTPKLNCYQHRFTFTHAWTQYFGLQMVVKRKESTSTGTVEAPKPPLSKSLYMTVSWYGIKDGQATLVVDGSQTRKVMCDSTAKKTLCYPTFVFEVFAVKYPEYAYEVAFINDPQGNANTNDWIEDITFNMAYRNFLYSMYEAGCYVTLDVLAGLLCVAFNVKICLSKKKKSIETLWCQVLTFALFLYNNPLYMNRYWYPAGGYAWASVVFEMTFFALLVCFWLISLDSLSYSQTFSYPLMFYIPKFLYCAIMWAVGMGAFGVILVEENKNPLFDWASDTTMRRGVTTFIIIGLVSLGLWVSWLTVKALRYLKEMSEGNRFFFIYHVFMIVSLIIGLIANGVIYKSTVTSVGGYQFFHVGISTYIAILCYLCLPNTKTDLYWSSGLDAEDEVEETGPVRLAEDEGISPKGKGGWGSKDAARDAGEAEMINRA
jgi:hypothetical protein